jgi:hypothetical protein
MDTAMIFALPVVLAVTLWWMARANEKRAADRAAAVRRTEAMASDPWIRPKPFEPAGEPSSAEDAEDAAILELSSSGGFRAFEEPADE